MNNGATEHALTHPVTPAQIKVAGLAGDLYGHPNGRPPLVLLSGLTYGRGIWQPVLDHLGRIDPGRQVLNLDLPGHGDSPNQFPHTMERIVGLVHEAVAEAGLGTPVLAGHSQSGGFASVYATQYPSRGVINVEASPDLWTFVQVIQALAADSGGDVLEVWRKMEQTFGLHLLPAEARARSSWATAGPHRICWPATGRTSSR
jgi:pimeloyl-ACP methyl ester carboxylesterase